MKEIYYVGSKNLTFEIIQDIIQSDAHLTLDTKVIQRIQKCRDYLNNKIVQSTEPIYGVTTGFGSLCNKNIELDQLTVLQENLIKSHACSIGNELSTSIIKLMLLFKAHALSLGYSGVQVDTVQRILDLYNYNILPVVYDRGSLGASGDLAPLANLFLPIIGEGEVYYKGSKCDTASVFKQMGWKPIILQSKEGLALLNGTQFMTAVGTHILLQAFSISKTADVLAALSLDAFNGRIEPFIDSLHKLRPHQGQIDTAAAICELLKDSEITKQTKTHIQDPYSFRCIPQVHGASKDAIKYVASVVLTELNSVTDNPTVLPEEDLIISGGNFHGQPLALAYDFLAIALSELGNISERRIAQLILGNRDLPEFLVSNPGVNSGFMIPQYVAAALVSQNKMYCFPASSDSIVSSNGQEDHVSMGANSAIKLIKIVENLEYILAIELFNAAQAIEYRRPLKTSSTLETLIKEYRKTVPFVKEDVIMHTAINNSKEFLRNRQA